MRLDPGETFRSSDPTISIDGGMPPGRHRFRLEVIDDKGKTSRAAEVVVVVLPRALQRPAPR